MLNRTTFLTIGILFLTFSVSGQDAMPTKEETVNYLNRRLQEVDGRRPEVDSIPDHKFTNLSFTMKSDVVIFTFSWLAGSDGLRTNTFNPAHIEDVSIRKPSKGEIISSIYVNFKGKLVKQTCKRQCEESMDFVRFPYLSATPEAAEKIKKAFLHLRDLAKAEDDLF
jgi:hypothetical protein